MKIPTQLVNSLVKATVNRQSNKEEIVYGTIRFVNDNAYLVLDGGEELTPAYTTVKVENGDRVSCVLKNHVALITGNVTNNSASDGDVRNLNGDVRNLNGNVEDLNKDVQNLNNNITLQLVDANGKVTSEIKMTDYKIKLTGDVLADSISVSELFAKDITATGSFQVDNGVWAMKQNDNGITFGLGLNEGIYKFSILKMRPSAMQFSCGKDGLLSFIADDFVINDMRLSGGDWTPTVSGASAYTVQSGNYLCFGNIVVVSFAVQGTFSGSSTSRISISGCPVMVKPSNNYCCGSGGLSGYTSSSNVVFTGWQTSSDGKFYAIGQETNTSNKNISTAIYQNTSGSFLASGTIAYTCNNSYNWNERFT